jgi:hypothetical protein
VDAVDAMQLNFCLTNMQSIVGVRLTMLSQPNRNKDLGADDCCTRETVDCNSTTVVQMERCGQPSKHGRGLRISIMDLTRLSTVATAYSTFL